MGKVAASIRRLPGPRRIKGAAAVTGGVSDGANDRNGVAAAVVGRSGRIESPGGPLLHRLIGAAASDDRRSGIDHSHFLTALGEVAASIGIVRASVACQVRVASKVLPQ